MSNALLIVATIACIIVVMGFIWLIRMILGLQKNMNKLTLEAGKKNENVLNNSDHSHRDTTIMIDAKGQDVNAPAETKIINADQVVEKRTAGNKEQQEVINVDRMVNSYLAKSDPNNEGEEHDFQEANIVRIRKTDGIQAEPVDPNWMSVTSSGQPYKLDIVIENTPINKVLKNENVERKR